MPVKRRMYTGDLKPDYFVVLTDTLEDGTEIPLDLTTAVGVRVIGVHIDPVTKAVTPVFDRSADTYNASGEITMSWQPDDTAIARILNTEIEIMWPGNKPQTIRPPEVIDIREDFGGGA